MCQSVSASTSDPLARLIPRRSRPLSPLFDAVLVSARQLNLLVVLVRQRLALLLLGCKHLKRDVVLIQTSTNSKTQSVTTMYVLRTASRQRQRSIASEEAQQGTRQGAHSICVTLL